MATPTLTVRTGSRLAERAFRDPGSLASDIFRTQDDEGNLQTFVRDPLTGTFRGSEEVALNQFRATNPPLIEDLEEPASVELPAPPADRSILPSQQEIARGAEEIFTPGLEQARGELSQIEERATLEAPRLREELEGERGRIVEDVATRFAPSFRRLEEDEARQVETARRISAGSGSGRGTRAAEMEGLIKEKASERRAALDSQRRLEERKLIAEAEGATRSQLEAFDSAISTARERVLSLEREQVEFERGLTEKSFEVAEQARQFDADLQIKAQNALTNAFRAELEGARLDASTQKDLVELALKMPLGQEVQVGDFLVTGLDVPEPNLQLMQTTDNAGNVSLISVNKNTGEVTVTGLGPIGKGAGVRGPSGPSSGLAFDPGMSAVYDQLIIAQAEGATPDELFALAARLEPKGDSKNLIVQADSYNRAAIAEAERSSAAAGKALAESVTSQIERFLEDFEPTAKESAPAGEGGFGGLFAQLPGEDKNLFAETLKNIRR